MMDEKRMNADMMVENDGENTAGALAVVEEAVDNELLLRLKKPYTFGGKTYTAVDLSPLEDATGADLAVVERSLKKRGIVDPLMEMSTALAAAMASRMCGLPEEFFLSLPIYEMVKVKTTVSGFLYGGGED